MQHRIQLIVSRAEWQAGNRLLYIAHVHLACVELARRLRNDDFRSTTYIDRTLRKWVLSPGLSGFILAGALAGVAESMTLIVVFIDFYLYFLASQMPSLNSNTAGAVFSLLAILYYYLS